MMLSGNNLKKRSSIVAKTSQIDLIQMLTLSGAQIITIKLEKDTMLAEVRQW